MDKILIRGGIPLRGTVPVPRDADEAAVRTAALAVEKIRAQVEGKEIRKGFFVANRLINLIVG